ncbi:MAG: PleD family two-component system response regulator [Rickettsia endosymbiont of Ixodes persulcatus]|nr:PleD family two-component system response regulator [Rickettsia endosymbiont of Ixodes persulcatus]MCZ6901507.1 PleD family two-component system response regulator [Rickettsia endosymbiont of Ixodes persulcatus]MCZ6903226.1 PleD family two-component system response regulator [Rickettsia endosymbiont of Ixodes persulcatus]MCZ6908531.1 PleD family two-component system response regulator [Rickettsia endosymbiont of Ixodes persulcatus]MCZ6909608.1 PleD family two-component system response regula
MTTILVVDDIETNIKLLTAKLLKEYYTVLTANSGKEALAILKKEKIDIILLDVMMPEMDGFEVCKTIKTDPETTHIPVVMVTALSDIDDRVKGLEAGADEFLTKPINDTALFVRLKSLSRMKSLIDELKLRNSTNALLGITNIEMHETFADKKILLINDDVVQAKNIKQMLLKITANVKVISNSDELDIINEYTPDLVIISSMLENEDPLRISIILRGKAEISGVVIILQIDEDGMPLVVKGIELGINDYFVYPIEESELLARIKTQLRRKQYQDNLRNDLEQSVNLAAKDGLTGLFNRRYFDIHLKQMIEKTNKESIKLYLLMCDIDNFKHVNDTYGHQAGDKVLTIVSRILNNTLRVTDLIARFGGEEFTILLTDIDISQAIETAERVRVKIEYMDFHIEDQMEPLKKTISIGVTEYKKEESIESFIERADKAMYEAKTTGKNKVVKL